MKKIILISALLFSFNGWAETIEMSCESYSLYNSLGEIFDKKAYVSLLIEPDAKTVILNSGMKYSYEEEPYPYDQVIKFISLIQQIKLNKVTGELVISREAEDGSLVSIDRYICKVVEPLF